MAPSDHPYDKPAPSKRSSGRPEPSDDSAPHSTYSKHYSRGVERDDRAEYRDQYSHAGERDDKTDNRTDVANRDDGSAPSSRPRPSRSSSDHPRKQSDRSNEYAATNQNDSSVPSTRPRPSRSSSDYPDYPRKPAASSPPASHSVNQDDNFIPSTLPRPPRSSSDHPSYPKQSDYSNAYVTPPQPAASGYYTGPPPPPMQHASSSSRTSHSGNETNTKISESYNTTRISTNNQAYTQQIVPTSNNVFHIGIHMSSPGREVAFNNQLAPAESIPIPRARPRDQPRTSSQDYQGPPNSNTHSPDYPSDQSYQAAASTPARSSRGNESRPYRPRYDVPSHKEDEEEEQVSRRAEREEDEEERGHLDSRSWRPLAERSTDERNPKSRRSEGATDTRYGSATQDPSASRPSRNEDQHTYDSSNPYRSSHLPALGAGRSDSPPKKETSSSNIPPYGSSSARPIPQSSHASRQKTRQTDDDFEPDYPPPGSARNHPDSKDEEQGSTARSNRLSRPSRSQPMPSVSESSSPPTNNPYGSVPRPSNMAYPPQRWQNTQVAAHLPSRDNDPVVERYPSQNGLPDVIPSMTQNRHNRPDEPSNYGQYSTPLGNVGVPIPSANSNYRQTGVSPPTTALWPNHQSIQPNPFQAPNMWPAQGPIPISLQQTYAPPNYPPEYPQNHAPPNYAARMSQDLAHDIPAHMANMSISGSSARSSTLPPISEAGLYQVPDPNSMNTLPDMVSSIGNPVLVPFRRDKNDERWKGTADAHIRLIMSSNVIDMETLPLWYPKRCNPRDPYSTVRIGDLGYLDEKGDFHRILNILDPLENDRSYRPLRINIQDCIREVEIQKRHSYLSDSIRREDELKENSSRAYRFFVERRRGRSAAIIVVPNGGVSSYLRSKFFHMPEVKQYFRRHAAAWYQHAMKSTPNLSNGSLLLVRGVHVAKTWGVAAFSSKTELTQSVSATFRPTASNRYEYLWEAYDHRWRTHRGPPAQELEMLQRQGRGPEINQCFGLMLSSLELDPATWETHFASSVRSPATGFWRAVSRASSMSSIRSSIRVNNRGFHPSLKGQRQPAASPDDYELLRMEA